MNKSKKTKIVLLILILCVTLGYAILRTALNINGIATIPNVSWDVYFSNYQNSASTNITPTTEPSTPSGTKPTTVIYAVTLANPGDLYEFTIDIVNNGTIDANINLVSKLNGEEIDSENPIPDYLTYKITDTSDVDIPDDHRLNKNTTETIKVKILFREDVDPSDLPEEGATLQLDIELTATQAEKETTAYVYTKNIANLDVEGYNAVSLNEIFPTGIERFNSGEATGKNVYLKHKLGENDMVEESYVEFVITEAMKQQLKNTYCTDENYSDVAETKAACETKYDALVNGVYSLRGFDFGEIYDFETRECKAEYIDEEGECISPYDESNVEELKKAFGNLINNENVCSFGVGFFDCSIPGLEIDYEDVESLYVLINSWACMMNGNGMSFCNEY